MGTSIVILSCHSLFAEGIARRLQEYLQLADLRIVDPRQFDVVANLSVARPSFVILDITDPQTVEHCPLSELLLAFPDLRVICLDPREDQVQLVSGERRRAAEVRDLADMIEQST
jgi:hypothetical protein